MKYKTIIIQIEIEIRILSHQHADSCPVPVEANFSWFYRSDHSSLFLNS
jgi:hypothetical protein